MDAVTRTLFAASSSSWITVKTSDSTSGCGNVGGALIAYAAMVYPILSYLAGHVFPASPGFGLGTVPCPTTIFTFGLLLWTTSPVLKRLLVVPFLWLLIGLSAPINYSIYEDVGLVVAGLVGVSLLWWRDRQAAQPGALKPRFA